MKYPVTRFKSLGLALKELEPFIRNGRHLEAGKPFEQFGRMRSREMLANWLLCVVISSANWTKLEFSSDPIGGDGLIFDTATGENWPTEHVMVPRHITGDAQALILQAIDQKRDKGAAYAHGKTLVVFLDASAARWFPNRVARQLPQPLHFAAVWVVGLQTVKAGEYVYGVTHLDVSDGDAPTFLVRIRKDFEAWEIVRLQ
jgi:hypothetical protein